VGSPADAQGDLMPSARLGDLAATERAEFAQVSDQNAGQKKVD